MLLSTEREKLGNFEGSRMDACISLGRRSRIDFAGELGLGEDGNRRNQAGVNGWGKCWKR